MTIPTMRAMIHNKPFVPFTVVTADGGTHRVKHPELVALTGDDRVIFIGKGPHGFSLLDIGLITEVRYDPADLATEANGS